MKQSEVLKLNAYLLILGRSFSGISEKQHFTAKLATSEINKQTVSRIKPVALECVSHFSFASLYLAVLFGGPSFMQAYVSVVSKVTTTQLRKAKVAIQSAIEILLITNFQVLFLFPNNARLLTSLSDRQKPLTARDSLDEPSSVNKNKRSPGQTRNDQP